MRVLDATVNWMYGWGNMPRLFLLIDTMPDGSNLRYQFHHVAGRQPDHGLYYAELDGHVRFYCYNGPDEGYGGRKFHLTMEDGSERILAGPWSSRPGVMNQHFTHSVDVTFADGSGGWEERRTWYGGNVTAELACAALLKFCPYAKYRFDTRNDAGVRYIIVPTDGDSSKPPTPDKSDARWDSYGMWCTGVRGSEKFRLSNEED